MDNQTKFNKKCRGGQVSEGVHSSPKSGYPPEQRAPHRCPRPAPRPHARSTLHFLHPRRKTLHTGRGHGQPSSTLCPRVNPMLTRRMGRGRGCTWDPGRQGRSPPRQPRAVRPLHCTRHRGSPCCSKALLLRRSKSSRQWRRLWLRNQIRVWQTRRQACRRQGLGEASGTQG